MGNPVTWCKWTAMATSTSTTARTTQPAGVVWSGRPKMSLLAVAVVVVALTHLRGAEAVPVARGPDSLNATFSLPPLIQIAHSDLERAIQQVDQLSDFQAKIAQLLGISPTTVQILDMNLPDSNNRHNNASVRATIQTTSPAENARLRSILNIETKSKAPRDMEQNLPIQPRLSVVWVQDMVGDPVFWNALRPSWLVLLVEVAAVATTAVETGPSEHTVTVSVCHQPVLPPFGVSEPITLAVSSAPVPVVIEASANSDDQQQHHVSSSYTLGLLRANPVFVYRVQTFLEVARNSSSAPSSVGVSMTGFSNVLEGMGIHSADYELIGTSLDANRNEEIDYHEYHSAHVFGLIPSGTSEEFLAVAKELSSLVHTEWLAFRSRNQHANATIPSFWSDRYGLSVKESNILSAQLNQIKQQLHPHASSSAAPVLVDFIRMAASGTLPLPGSIDLLQHQLNAFSVLEQMEAADDCLYVSEVVNAMTSVGFSREQSEWVASGMLEVYDLPSAKQIVTESGKCVGLGAFVLVDVSGFFPIAAVALGVQSGNGSDHVRAMVEAAMSKVDQAQSMFRGMLSGGLGSVSVAAYQHQLESQLGLASPEAWVLAHTADRNHNDMVTDSEHAAMILTAMLLSHIPDTTSSHHTHTHPLSALSDLERSPSQLEATNAKKGNAIKRCTVDNRACSFPFEYQGRIVHDCITDTPPPRITHASTASASASASASTDDIQQQRPEGWCAVCSASCEWCGVWAFCKSRDLPCSDDNDSMHGYDKEGAKAVSDGGDVWPDQGVQDTNKNPAPAATTQTDSTTKQPCGGQRTFANPTVEVLDEQARAKGDELLALAWCSPPDAGSANTCGQVVADDFCKQQKLEGSQLYVAASRVVPADQIETSATSDISGAVCSANCATFKSITCLLPACDQNDNTQTATVQTTPPTTAVTELSAAQKLTTASTSASDDFFNPGVIGSIECSTYRMFLALNEGGTAMVVDSMEERAKWLVHERSDAGVVLKHVTSGRFLVASVGTEGKPTEISSSSVAQGPSLAGVWDVHVMSRLESSVLVTLHAPSAGYLALDQENEASIRQTEESASTTLKWNVLEKGSVPVATANSNSNNGGQQSDPSSQQPSKKKPGDAIDDDEEGDYAPTTSKSQQQPATQTKQTPATTTAITPTTATAATNKNTDAAKTEKDGKKQKVGQSEVGTSQTLWQNQLAEHSDDDGARDDDKDDDKDKDKDKKAGERLIEAEDADDVEDDKLEADQAELATMAVLDDHDRNKHLVAMQKRKLYAEELQHISVQYLQDILKTFLQFMHTSYSGGHPFLSRRELSAGLQLVARRMEYREAYKIAMIMDSENSGKIGLSEFCQAVDLALVPRRGNSTDPDDFFLSADEQARVTGTRGYAAVEHLYQHFKGTRSASFPKQRMVDGLQQYGLSVEVSRFLANQIDRRGRGEILFEDFLHSALWGLVPRHRLMAVELELAVQTFLYLDTNGDGLVYPRDVTAGMLRQGYQDDVAQFTGNTVEANYGQTRPPTFKWLRWLMAKGIVPSVILEGTDEASTHYRNDFRERMLLIVRTFAEHTSSSKTMKQPELMAALINGGMNREQARFFSKLPFLDFNGISLYQFASIISFKNTLLIKPSSMLSRTMLKDPRTFSNLRSIASAFQDYSQSSSASEISKDQLVTALTDQFKWGVPESMVVSDAVFRTFALFNENSQTYEVPVSSNVVESCGTTKTEFRLNCSSTEDSVAECRAPFDICYAKILDQWGDSRCTPGFTFEKLGNKISVYHGCAGKFALRPFGTDSKPKSVSYSMFYLSVLMNVLPIKKLGKSSDMQAALSNSVVQTWKVYCSLAGLKDKVQFSAPVPKDRLVDNLLEARLHYRHFRNIYREKGQMTRAIVRILLDFFRDSGLFGEDEHVNFQRFVRGRMLQLIPDPDNEDQLVTIAQDAQMFSLCTASKDDNSIIPLMTVSSLHTCLQQKGMKNETADFLVQSIFAPFPGSVRGRGLSFDQFRWATGGKYFPRDLVPNLNRLQATYKIFLTFRPESRGIPIEKFSHDMQLHGWPLFYINIVLKQIDSDSNQFISLFELWEGFRTSQLLYGNIADSGNNGASSVLNFIFQAAKATNNTSEVLLRLFSNRGFGAAKARLLVKTIGDGPDSLKRKLQLAHMGLFSFRLKSLETNGRIYFQDWSALNDAISGLRAGDKDDSGTLTQLEFNTMLKDFISDDDKLALLWSVLDTNNDDELDLLEYLRARELTLAPSRQNGVRIVERMTWLNDMFSQYDTDESGSLTVSEIRLLAPQGYDAVDVSAMLIVASHGMQGKVQLKEFYEMVLEGSILCRELEITPLEQMIEDIRQYYFALKSSKSSVDRERMAHRLEKRERYSEQEARLVTLTAFLPGAKEIDIYAFASAVMRQVVVIPLSMTRDQIRQLAAASPDILALDPAIHSGNNTNNSSSDVNSDTVSSALIGTLAMVRNISVSSAVKELSGVFDPHMLQAYEVLVPPGTEKVTVTVSFESSQKVLVNDWNIASDEASPPIPISIKHPSAIYVKVIPTSGSSRVYTVIVRVDTSQASSRIRCTTSEGGSAIANRLCMFPFEYPPGSKQQHYTCILDSTNQEWCSTTSLYQGEWGYCKPAGDKSCLSAASTPGASHHNASSSAAATSSSTTKKSPKTARQVLEREIKSFQLFGADSRGYLSVGSLEEGLIHMGQSRDMAHLLATVTDFNADGYASLHEVVRSIHLGMLPGLESTERSPTFQLVMQLHSKFAESGSIGVTKLRRLFVNQVHLSGGMAQLIVDELDTDRNGLLSQVELLRGAHRSLIPLEGGAVQKQFRDAAQAYERYAVSQRSPASTDDLLAHTTRNDTWGITVPLTALELQKALANLALPKSDALLVARATLLNLGSKDTGKQNGETVVLFSSFLGSWTAKLVPQPTAATDVVKKTIQGLSHMFRSIAGNELQVTVGALAKYFEGVGWTPADSALVAQAITLDITSQVDLPTFVRAFVEGVVPMESHDKAENDKH